MLTGTDIVDHFRMVRLSIEEEELFLNKDYEESKEENINKMLKEATELAASEE